MFCKGSLCEKVKLFCSFVVVTLLILVVFTGISMQYCVLKVNPALGFLISTCPPHSSSPSPACLPCLALPPTRTWPHSSPPHHSARHPHSAVFFCLSLLAYVEALHYACVACEKWDSSVLKDYPRALRCHALVDTPVKLKKFLVGRQFFVIFVVFLLAQLTAFPDMPDNFAGMPAAMTLILLQTGLPGVALTLTYGQLISQIFVEQYPAQFLNLLGTEFVIRLSLLTENIGTCHWAWLLYHSVSSLACRSVNKARDQLKSTDGFNVSVNDHDQVLSPTEKIRGPDFDLGIEGGFTHAGAALEALKYMWSAFLTVGSIGLVFYGIGQQAYVLNVAPGAAFVIVFVDLAVLFFLEGLMICIVETQYW
jgi:hypothetical protein